MKDQIDQKEAKTQKENKKMIEKALKLTQNESRRLTWKRERERKKERNENLEQERWSEICKSCEMFRVNLGGRGGGKKRILWR